MKKKLLPLAMLAGLAGAAGTAQAVHVNSDGLGETLIYPFYTVEEGQNTYIGITNTTDAYKAVKVRFLEAENSAEVLDFNLYLSPHDVWTGAIVPHAEGAKLITRDNSCTAPYIPRPDEEGEGQDGQPFVDYEYRGDGGTAGVIRTREGYMEVIEMGVIVEPLVQAEILHNPAGIPNSGDGCDDLRARWGNNGAVIQGGTENPGVVGNGYWRTPNTPQNGFSQTSSQLGGLYGYGVIINPAEGSASGYNAVALDGFFSTLPLYASQHTDPGTTLPSLGSAFEEATVFNGTTATTYGTIDGWDAVSAVFMHNTVSNDFMLDSFVNGDTDWVMTMPTKREYVNTILATDDDGDTETVWDDTQPRPPFTTAWTGSACEELGLEIWDREEAVTTVTDGLDFSPRPPADSEPDAFSICKEVSVLSFGEGGALHPSSRIQYGVPDISYQNGWARVNFATYGDTAALRYIEVEDIDAAADVYLVGLPVTGFAVQKYVNGALESGLLANYAALIQHNYTRRIDTDAPADLDDRYPGTPPPVTP